MIKIDKNAKTRVIYHYWNDKPVCKPYKDMANPIVPSIAALRSVNSAVPITVLDVSKKSKNKPNWGDFPSLLNFEVVPWRPMLNQDLPNSSRLCSRVWDVWGYSQLVKENKILFNDADIFWIRNPFPLAFENDGMLRKFYCSNNTGVWYFDSQSSAAKEVVDIWKSIIARGIIGDKEFNDELVEMFPHSTWFQDEVAFNYLTKKHPRLLNPVDKFENFWIMRLRQDKSIKVHEIKCLHMLACMFGAERGKSCLVIKELRDAVSKVLTPAQMEMVFGDFVRTTVYTLEKLKSLSHKDWLAFLTSAGNSKAAEDWK